MLFTDIEGSTALLSRLGDRYAEALSAHRALVRAEIAAWRGREISTEGDSFFVVFAAAPDAIGCCLAAQRALATHDWPDGLAVRVRMGLHSGEPARHEDNYVGMDVHRAARIAATAHGGQVVLSDATRRLADARMPAGTSVRDLGFHRLKDIEEAERIYQLIAPGLPAGFPPLKSLGTPTSLPVPATPLVGRSDELAGLCAAIEQPEVRLVTLTGTGGVGKTRLSLAAAAALDHSFPHGVYFVALAAVRDAEVMWKALADALAVNADGPPAGAVTGYLAGRRALLVLDNLEQLDGAAEVVAGLLAAAPGVVVLATSRGPLHLPGEYERPVPPLGLPGRTDPAEVAAASAVRLFVQQAAMSRPGFALTEENAADVAAICDRLDGLPLAIELAASRVRLLSPRALLTRLRASLELPAGAGRPLRQQTLRNTVAWSYELLDPDAARVFRRMGVFAGGCDLAALAAVTVPDGDPLEVAASLLDVSLVTMTEGADGEPRLGQLETIREYARERLAQEDDLEEARRRHAEHYLAVAERAAGQLDSAVSLAALDRLEAEHDNLRAALAWSLETPAGSVTGLRLGRALTAFWYEHGHAAEGRRWLQRAVDVASADGGAPLAGVAHGLGVLLDQQGDAAAATRLFELSLSIWRELGDREQQARELNSLGITHRHLGEIDEARVLLQEAIAINRETGAELRLAASLANLGQLESSAGQLDRAAELLQEALALDENGGSEFGVAVDRHSLALVTLRNGRPAEALEMMSALSGYLANSGNAAMLVNSLELGAAIMAELGDTLRAARLAGAADALRQQYQMFLSDQEAAMLEEFLAPARSTVPRPAWDAELAAGRALTEPEAIELLLSLGPP